MMWNQHTYSGERRPFLECPCLVLFSRARQPQLRVRPESNLPALTTVGLPHPQRQRHVAPARSLPCRTSTVSRPKVRLSKSTSFIWPLREGLTGPAINRLGAILGRALSRCEKIRARCHQVKNYCTVSWINRNGLQSSSQGVHGQVRWGMWGLTALPSSKQGITWISGVPSGSKTPKRVSAFPNMSSRARCFLRFTRRGYSLRLFGVQSIL